MKYPKKTWRGSSRYSSQSQSIANTTVTNLSETDVPVNCQNGEESTTDEFTQRIPEEDHVEGLKFLAERDMRSLHKHIPALGRQDVQMSGIRKHFYPEGGWGWVVVICRLGLVP